MKPTHDTSQTEHECAEHVAESGHGGTTQDYITVPRNTYMALVEALEYQGRVLSRLEKAGLHYTHWKSVCLASRKLSKALRQAKEVV